MSGFGRVKKILPLLLVLFPLLAAGIGAGVFLGREPILVVTDPTFLQIYGDGRMKMRQAQIAFRFFRRVLPVTVAENAGPDIIALAARDASPEPWAVLFPYRYLDAALLYRESDALTPIFVIGADRLRPPEEDSLTVVYTDTAADLLRAGICAASIAGDKKILVFHDELFPAAERDALTEELASRGFAEAPFFLRSFADYSSYDEVGCAVVAGPAVRFLERALDIPVVLFSWTDPVMTPHTVKLVFDDSHWALALEALKSLSSRGRNRSALDTSGSGGSPSNEIVIPSVPALLRERFTEKKDFRQIKDLLKEKLQKS